MFSDQLLYIHLRLLTHEGVSIPTWVRGAHVLLIDWRNARPVPILRKHCTPQPPVVCQELHSRMGPAAVHDECEEEALHAAVMQDR